VRQVRQPAQQEQAQPVRQPAQQEQAQPAVVFVRVRSQLRAKRSLQPTKFS
jgi:hypothetical protein